MQPDIFHLGMPTTQPCNKFAWELPRLQQQCRVGGWPRWGLGGVGSLHSQREAKLSVKGWGDMELNVRLAQCNQTSRVVLLGMVQRLGEPCRCSGQCKRCAMAHMSSCGAYDAVSRLTC